MQISNAKGYSRYRGNAVSHLLTLASQLRSFPSGKNNLESGSFARLTLASDLSSVRSHNFLDDCQAEAGSGFIAVSGDAEESIEHMGLVFQRDADAGIRHS